MKNPSILFCVWEWKNEFFEDINNIKAENEALRQKNSQLEESLRELEIIKASTFGVIIDQVSY